MKWISNSDRLGISKGFIANAENYPPISTIVLAFTAKVARYLNISVFDGFKACLLLFLSLTSLFFYLWTRNILFAVMMQLTLLLNSVALCYIDIFFAPTLVGALWALHRGKLITFAILFTLSCLTKFQPLIIAPFLLVYLISYTRTSGSKSLMPALLVDSVVIPTFLILAAFFIIFGKEISSALTRAMLHHPQISANALNLNWLVTYFLHLFSPETYGPLVNGRVDLIMPEDSRLVDFPKLIFSAVYILILVSFSRREKSFENLLLFALLGYLSYFMLNTGVHENHLFLAPILSLSLYWVDRKYKAVGLALALFANINLVIFYGIHGSGLGFEYIIGIDLTVLISAIAVALFGIFFAQTLRIKTKQPEHEFPGNLRSRLEQTNAERFSAEA